MANRPNEVQAYDILRPALVKAGATLLREVPIDTLRPSRFEIWNVPSRGHAGELVVFQIWDNGGWDAYIPIKENVTEKAVAEVLGKEVTDGKGSG